MTYTVGMLPIEPKMYKTGFLTAANGASEQIILPVRTDIQIMWDPFYCKQGLECERPVINMQKTITPEMFRGKEAGSKLFSQVIALDTKGEGQEFQVTHRGHPTITSARKLLKASSGNSMQIIFIN